MGSNDQFSFDVYPGLNAELEAAFARNHAHGAVSPELVATQGIAAAVGSALQEQGSTMIGESEATAWAQNELPAEYIDQRWGQYGALLDILPPSNVATMIDVEPKIGTKLQRLHEAKIGILTSAGDTPEGQKVGDTLHLTLVPWQSFKSNLDKLPEWVEAMRGVQNKATDNDYINEELVKQIQSIYKIYRNPIAPHIYTTNNTSAPEWLSAREYLDQRIAEDGAWGVVLTQTSPEAGVKSLVGKSPDKLTDKGRKRLEIAGYKVDGLGIFEWLAMTFQHDPSELSPSDYSWMLANRLYVGGGARVPNGRWYGDRVRSALSNAGSQGGGARPRLAVI
jgi:hypothetical protein